MLDREARDKLAATMESYLNDEITAFAFDDKINEVAFSTTDETVEYVARTLWLFYDDCKDHKVVLRKDAWDYFWRLLLLLRADASVVRHWVWSWRQACAWVLLLYFWVGVAWLGCGMYLLLFIPVGAGSIALSRYYTKPVRQERDRRARTMPFESLAQILDVRRRLRGFKKRPYPPELSTRRVRCALLEADVTWALYVLWVIFSPFVLLWQLLPTRREHVIVKA